MQAPRTRVQRRPVHGVLLLDKPLGLSSNQALQKAKWLLRAEKAGHTGTLDPLATGVLPLCFGAATKFSQLHLDADKTYLATARLGVNTATADAEGEIIQTRPVQVTAEQVEAVVHQLTGPQQQRPPMYSALKKDGRPLYEYARQGQDVERVARHITVHSLKIVDMQLTGDAPYISFVAHCSKGTYIRTLGEDLGNALGCGAHLTALRRIRTGEFEVPQCVSLQALENMDEAQRMRCIQPTDILLQQHVHVTLDASNAGRFLSGMRRRGEWANAANVAVYAQEPRILLGTAHITAGELIPSRLLSPLDIKETQLQNELLNLVESEV